MRRVRVSTKLVLDLPDTPVCNILQSNLPILAETLRLSHLLKREARLLCLKFCLLGTPFVRRRSRKG